MKLVEQIYEDVKGRANQNFENPILMLF